MKAIALMGGSFNPIHNGHIQVARHIAKELDLEAVLMCVSPLNPLKADAGDMADDTDRLAMTKLACENYGNLIPCDVEFGRTLPTYTIDTLHKLRDIYPGRRIMLVIGSDNWLIFNKWKAHEEIIRDFGVIIHPRPGYPVGTDAFPGNVTYVDAPQFDMSSTEIRRLLEEHLPVNNLISPAVYQYIKKHHLYGA